MFAGLCSQVFSEYLLLKRAYEKGTERDVGEIAWRARNLLELSVWSRYCSASEENAQRIYEDATRDLNGVLVAFEKWGKATTQPAEWFEKGTSAQQEISDKALLEGVAGVDEPFKRVNEAAKEIGIGPDFELFNKLLSKCAHPTAMKIVFSSNKLLTTWQRDSFFRNGCLFFVGAFSALEEHIFQTSRFTVTEGEASHGSQPRA